MIYASKSEQGMRERNEDNIFTPQRGEVSLVIVADGMGGHNAGQLASAIAVETASQQIKKGGNGTPDVLLKRAVEAANKAVFEKAKTDGSLRGMGTTMVMALLFRGRFVAVNVGDSRLYHYNGRALTQITQDHSFVAELVAAGYITREEAAHHPKRNIITRALGTREKENADVFEHRWREGDILLLCSDGLYDSLEDQDIKRILHEETDLQSACEQLVQNAMYSGSTDNISIVLVKNEEAR